MESEDTSIDGIKELLLAARSSYQSDMGHRGRRITLTHLSKCLQYIRNLSLIQRRLTPDLVTIVTGCQQILGDEFMLQVAELANHYQYGSDPFEERTSNSTIKTRYRACCISGWRNGQNGQPTSEPTGPMEDN